MRGRFFMVLFRNDSLCRLFSDKRINQESYADEDERNAENLSHIERHSGLEGLLDVLGKLDEEAEGEDERQAKAKEETASSLLFALPIEVPSYEEKQEVGNGFVELSRVAGGLVDALKDESPWHIGHLADDFRVPKVSQADAARRDWGGNGNVVQHLPQIEMGFAPIEPQGDHQSQRAAVTGESLIANKLPSPAFHEADGQKHLDDMLSAAEKIVGLIEETVTQARADDDAEEAIDEKRIEVLVSELLVLIEPAHHEVGTHKPDDPPQGIPVYAIGADVESHCVGIPDNIGEKIIHNDDILIGVSEAPHSPHQPHKTHGGDGGDGGLWGGWG